MSSKLINPYENIGQTHNLYLDKIISKVDVSNINHENKSKTLQNAIEEVLSEGKLERLTFDLNHKKDNESFINELDKLNIYQESKEFIKELIKIDTNLNLIEQRRKVLEIEKEILLAELNNKDRILPLTATSIAKHSIEYWNNVQNKNFRENFKFGLWDKLWHKLELIKSSGIWKADVKGCFDNSTELLLLGELTSNNLENGIGLIALKAAIASSSEFIFSKKR